MRVSAGLIAIAAITIGAAPAALGPDAEAKVIAVITEYASRYTAAPNSMAQGALRPQRGRTLCSSVPVIPMQGQVRDWVGTVELLSADSVGDGVLAVRLSPTMTITTHTIEWGDEDQQTLIKLGTPLHNQAVALTEGQKVRFSGHFFPDKVDCFSETSLTVTGAMNDPSFLFKFTAVSPTE